MKFKTEEIEVGFASVHPIVQELARAVDKWSLAYDAKEITLTDTLSDPERDKKLNRESPAHSQGRAVDIRVRDMSAKKITDLVKFFTEKYLYLGYLRKKSGKRCLMYLHGEGDSLHIHMAIGLDVIEKYKKSYPKWMFPVHTKKQITKALRARRSNT